MMRPSKIRKYFKVLGKRCTPPPFDFLNLDYGHFSMLIGVAYVYYTMDEGDFLGEKLVDVVGGLVFVFVGGLDATHVDLAVGDFFGEGGF